MVGLTHTDAFASRLRLERCSERCDAIAHVSVPLAKAQLLHAPKITFDLLLGVCSALAGQPALLCEPVPPRTLDGPRVDDGASKSGRARSAVSFERCPVS